MLQTTQQTYNAASLGCAAYESGLPRIPAKDPKLLSIVNRFKASQHDQRSEVLRSWYDGYDAANVADFILCVDGATVNKSEFLNMNAAPDVTPLHPADIAAINALQPDQNHFINDGAGGLCHIKRLLIVLLAVFTLASCSIQYNVKHNNSNRFGGYHGSKNIKCRGFSDDSTFTHNYFINHFTKTTK